jgi:hypothetical protein
LDESNEQEIENQDPSGLVNRTGEITLRSAAMHARDLEMNQGPLHRGSIEEDLLLRTSQEAIERLIEYPLIRNAVAPSLLHADLHKRGIYVSDDDPTIIAGLINRPIYEH